MSEKRKKEKTNQQYRRDIFTLKNRIKQEEQYLEEIKEKCSEVDIFVEQSYSFQMKIKILESNDDFAMIKQKMDKYSQDQFKKFYDLNFCAYALSRACTVVGLKPEMVFRCVDRDNKGIVQLNDLVIFFREVLNMDSRLFSPIVSQLDLKETGLVEEQRYQKLLSCFMIDTEKPEILEKDRNQKNQILEAVERVCLQMLRMECRPRNVWTTELVNVATTAGALKKRLKNLDNLDCVAVYCRCDPTKQGAIESEKVIKTLQNQMESLRKFDVGSLKKIKLKQ